jgi:hypothetical protein
MFGGGGTQAVAVGVIVALGVRVDVTVAEGVRVKLGVCVAVKEAVGVRVGVGVGVDGVVAVDVGIGPPGRHTHPESSGSGWHTSVKLGHGPPHIRGPTKPHGQPFRALFTAVMISLTVMLPS